MMRAYLLLSFVLLLAACAAPVPAVDNSPVIARIAGEELTLAEFERQLEEEIGPGIANLLAEGQTREQVEQLAADVQIRTRIFDQLIQDRLLLDYARRNGIGVDPAAIDAALPPPPAADPSIPVDPAAEPTPTSAERRADEARRQLVFEVIARNTRTEMVRARHMLVSTEAEADALLAELAAGADFAELARARSSDTVSAAEGGELGWTPRGNFDPGFEAVAFTAPLNTPTKAQSQFGWHVIDVLEREAERPFASFDELRQVQNAQNLVDESFTPWYEELRRQAEQSGELQLADGFDPNSVPLPFPDET